MELSSKCKAFFGVTKTHTTPFGKHVESSDGVFAWPAFEEAVGAICHAVRRRQLLLLTGVPCSAKTTAWNEAVRRLRLEFPVWHLCRPQGLDVSDYNEINIYRCIKEEILPFDGSRETAFRRDREARGRQCRQLLEQANEATQPVCLVVNDAHDCKMNFLLLLKRMWDDLYGFDRLLSVVWIGHPSLQQRTSQINEIAERLDVVRMEGLGKHLEEYLHHECGRCGMSVFPFEESALRELGKLSTGHWTTSRDHPLMVNNIVSRAMHDAWRIKMDRLDAALIANAIRATAAMA